MREYPKQTGWRIGKTREAWSEGKLNMMVDTEAPITIERKGPQDFVFHFLAVGRTWGLFADWYRYSGYTKREAMQRFRREYGLIGAHLTFCESN